MASINCRVCNKMYDGSKHCSVNACKACSMFFKRSELWDSMPQCRDGKGECRLDKIGKIFCSACRYQKCIEAGLKSKKNRRLKCIKRQQQYSDCSIEDFAKSLNIHHLVDNDMPMLKRFAFFYAQSRNNTRDNQYALLQADGAKLIELPGNRLAGQYTQSLSNRMKKHDISEFYKVMNGTFPAFTAMENSSQDNLIYLLIFPLFQLSASFRSLRVFNNVNSRKILCTEALFTDLDDLSGFLESEMFANPIDHKASENYIKLWWGRFLNSTLRTMHRIKITDVEFLAVCALTIWDEANFHHNPALSTIAEKHRNMIFKDLDYYYRNILHIENYVERVMNFKELSSIIKNNNELLLESFHFLRTFNYYSNNEEYWDTSVNVFDAFNRLRLEH